jgi:ketosteroid isomerase-like protein
MDTVSVAGVVETVQRGIARWNAGDLKGWLAMWHEDCEWVSAVTSSVDGNRAVYRGHDELRGFWEDNHDAWGRFEVEVLSANDLGNGLVFTSGRVQARGRRSGLELDSPLYFLWRLDEGRFLRASAHLERDDALEALRAEGVAEDMIAPLREG